VAVAYLGIGSNLGDRQAHIQKAVALLREHEHVQVQAVSALIETEPEGGVPQGKFLNGAVKINTDLMPNDLLAALKSIERRCGRLPVRQAGTKTEPNGPRSLDLDILLYDDVVIVEGKTLSIPHPRMAERSFVLRPLAEIAPEAVHPRLQKTVRELLENH
jgi:2-amino-4-hydroxy-6-hydroxymethyldihydropteridine diphosphokinase